jgi:hypothetical protein
MMKRDSTIMRMAAELVLKLVSMRMMIMLQIFKPMMEKRCCDDDDEVCCFASQEGITHFVVIDP